MTPFARRVSSAASRDLPTPGGPTTTATRAADPSTARFSARRSAASSRLRPTSGASRRRSNAGATGLELEQAKRVHGLALALDLERAERLERGGMVDQAAGELADDDLVRTGRCLELRRDPDRLAGDEALARVRRRRDDLAGLDPDPDLEPDSVLLQRAAR